MMQNKEEIAEILEELENVHYQSGPLYQRIERLKAENCSKSDELQAIYHLAESHVPGLRFKTILRSEKILDSNGDNQMSILNKEFVKFKCSNSSIGDNVESMLEKMSEMPEQWTIIQLTPKFNVQEHLEVNPVKYYTNPIHISVFKCGETFAKPFLVTVEAPRDNINGKIIELTQELHSIISDNKEILTYSRTQRFFKDTTDRVAYFNKRLTIDDRMRRLVKDIQDLWLKEWRCLFVGKCVSKGVEDEIKRRVDIFFKTEAPDLVVKEKALDILPFIVKTRHNLKLIEFKQLILHLFPQVTNKKFYKTLFQFITNLNEELSISSLKKYPIILIIDDSLDCFPWEMIEILQNQQVSRLPSLHLLYALFKQHKSTIVNGYKLIENYENGRFIVNPDSDLKHMESRILTFLNYWQANWTGIAGKKPTDLEFEDILTQSDIFSYNGHGAGTQFFSMEKIQKLRIKSVVLLLGCSSTKLNKVGPQSEMYGPCQMYLIAGSPCVVGMLWEVTDMDTDLLTTDFMSIWIPSKAPYHWKCLDNTNWCKGEQTGFVKTKLLNKNGVNQEMELLEALNLSKKSMVVSFYLTKAACVARGLPVKIP